MRSLFGELNIWSNALKKLVHTPTGDEVEIAYISKRTGKIVHDLEAVRLEDQPIDVSETN